MAEVQTASPVPPSSGGLSHRVYPEPRPHSQGGSRPSSRVGFHVSEIVSPRPNSRQGSPGARIPHPPTSRGSDSGAGSPLRERPPSVRTLREKTEMSDFLAPMVKTAVRRWKRFHEQRIREKFLERREEKRVRIETARQERRRLARRIPVDALAMEWLNENNVTVDARAYLLDSLLPTLILGIEKLLLEAEKRGLAESNLADPNFNPINFLAQYLMRNNPKYSNFPEASPYIRGVREVTEELRKYVFSFEDNRLAKIKLDARLRREEQECQTNARKQERLQRSARLRQNYQQWLIDDDGLIELQVLQTAAVSFADVMKKLPEDVKKLAPLTDMLAKKDELTGKVGADEFVQYLKQQVAAMTPELFNQFMLHLNQCASAYRWAAVLEARREVLSNLFKTCDHAGAGVIDRHRVMGLFEYFWDNSVWAVTRYLRNPRKWPVVELNEATEDLDSISENSVAGRGIPKSPATNAIAKNLGPTPVEDKEEENGKKPVMEEDRSQEPASVDDGTEDVITASGEKLNIGASPVRLKTEADTGEVQGQTTLLTERQPIPADPQTQPEIEETTKSQPDSQDVVSEQPPEEATGQKDKPGAQEAVPLASASESAEKEPTTVQAPGEEPTGSEPIGSDTAEKVPTTAEEVPTTAKAPDSEPTGSEPIGSDTAVEVPTTAEEVPTTAEEVPATAEEVPATAEEVPATAEEVPATAEDVPATAEDVPATAEDVPATAEEALTTAEEVPTTAEEVPATAEKVPAAWTDQTSETNLPDNAVDETSNIQAVTFHSDAKTAELSAKSATQIPKSPTKTPTSHRCGSVATSIFDENVLNCSQFVAFVEAFLSEETPEDVIQQLIRYLEEGYVETEEEKYLRLQTIRRSALSAKRKLMMEQLFEKWDNDGSGYLDLEELHSVMSKFKENMEAKIMQKAKAIMQKEDYDNRLSKKDFKAYIEAVCTMLPGGEDNFDPLIEFLMTSIERSYEERIRGQARKKWLNAVISSAETSAASLKPVYKCVFNGLYKDVEQHGRGKHISANIAMLERNDANPTRGTTCLRYVASTPDDANFMLNKILYRDMKGISFTSIDTGKPIHVPRVQNHGNIMFWNPERSDEKYKKVSVDEFDPANDRQGSYIVIPLKDHRKRVFGVMGIDTLNDPQEKSIFITHEISFFQGVAKAFSTAHQYVDIRRKMLRITESALAWIHRRSPSVHEINVYIVEPNEKDSHMVLRRRTPAKNRKLQGYISEESTKQLEDIVLRRMMTTDRYGNITTHDNPPKLERKENLFRDYLFKCVDNSDTVTADAYGQRHTAFPLRDPDGRAIALIDLSIGDLKQLATHENKEVQRMLKLLQAAHHEVSSESEGGNRTIVLEAEKGSDESRIDIMFDRIMLTDLRETVGTLNARAFAELKSYKDPPKVIHDILVSVLTLFYQDKADDGELESWNTCKQYVNQELIRKIEEFDPTASDVIGAVSKISSRLKDVPHGAVAKHGSLPAQNLYNWAFVCLSLLEHTSKMQESHKSSIITPPPSADKSDAPLEM